MYTSKRKTLDAMHVLPILHPDEEIARISDVRGNALFVVSISQSRQVTDNETLLVSLPSKFKNVVYIKRGSFVVVRREESKTKIKGEIVHVLREDHIKQYKAMSLWDYTDGESENKLTNQDGQRIRKDNSSDSDSNSDGDLFQNTNRSR